MLDGFDVVVALEQNGEQPVVLAARHGSQPSGHLSLDGDHDKCGGEGRCGQFDKQARGDGIGKIGDQFEAGSGKERRKVAVENIGVD